MDREVARHVIRASFRSFGELTDLLPLLKAQCDPEEYKVLAKMIASIGAEASLTLNKHVFAAFPGLEDEFQASIDKYGRIL